MESKKEKSEADVLMEAMAEVFNLATTGFDAFYNQANEKSSGDYSTSASSGYRSTSASSGYRSTSASSGDNSKSASSGNYSTSASSGKYSACAALGHRAAVKGDIGNLLMASEYILKDGSYVPIGGKVSIVDGKNIKPACWYIVEKGEWVEVDFTDNIFSYVLSSKNGVLKVRNESGEVLYIVKDEQGNTAHGKTIEEARKDLIYKVVSKFEGEAPKSATGKEWVGIYRAITGACTAGIKMFVEQQQINLDAEYTARQVVEIVKSQYGADRFADKLKEQDGE